MFHDLLGFVQHPHHQKVTPKFCKRFSEVGNVINDALSRFNEEVKNKTFPGAKYSPYPIKEDELTTFCTELRKKGFEKGAEAALKEFKTLRDE